MTAAKLDEIELEIVRQCFFYSKSMYEQILIVSKARFELKELSIVYNKDRCKDLAFMIDQSNKLIKQLRYDSRQIVDSILNVNSENLGKDGSYIKSIEKNYSLLNTMLCDCEMKPYPDGWIRNARYMYGIAVNCFGWYLSYIDNPVSRFHPRTRDKVLKICQEMLFGS